VRFDVKVFTQDSEDPVLQSFNGFLFTEVEFEYGVETALLWFHRLFIASAYLGGVDDHDV
jgi:hypothetical protein